MTATITDAPPIADYGTVKNWLLNVSKGSYKGYLLYLRRFCDFAQLDPDQLLKSAEQDRRSVHTKLKEFYALLRREGLSSKTSNGGYTAVRSFLAWNEVELGRTPRPFRGVAQYASRRILEPHEIALMISMARLTRDKAAISFLAQSGQRVGLVRSLRYGQVREQWRTRSTP